MRLIIPLILFVILVVIVVTFAPRSALFIITLGLLVLLDLYLVFWYYPKFEYSDRRIIIKRLVKQRELATGDVLEIRPGFYFPLFWMKSYKITFSKEGKRSYFLVYNSAVEQQNEAIERLVRDTNANNS